MPVLHDADTRSKIESRLRALTPESRPAWGKMSVDQMLWHVNQAMGLSLGTITAGTRGSRAPAWLMRALVTTMPVPRNAPTHPDLIATGRYDFSAERDLALINIASVAEWPSDRSWPVHPVFGKMSGRQVNTLTHKHLNHHLTQFGV